jgi:hypothetical protein
VLRQSQNSKIIANPPSFLEIEEEVTSRLYSTARPTMRKAMRPAIDRSTGRDMAPPVSSEPSVDVSSGVDEVVPTEVDSVVVILDDRTRLMGSQAETDKVVPSETETSAEFACAAMQERAARWTKRMVERI